MKKIGLICGGVVLLLLAIYFGGTSYVNGKIDDLVDKANKEDNQLSFGHRNLSFGFTHLGLQLDSIRLDQGVGSRRISGTIGQLDLDGLSVWEIIVNKNVNITDLLIDSPDLEIRSVATDTTKTTDSTSQSINIKQLRVIDGRIAAYDKDGKLKAKGFGVSSTASLNFPFAPAAAPDAQLTIDSLIFPGGDEADLTLSHTHLDSRAGTFSIGTLRLTPRQTAKAYLTSLQFKDDWMALRMDSLLMTGLPMDSLLAKRPAILPDVTIGDFNLAVFENPNLERKPTEKHKPFPVEQFRNLPFPVLLQRLHIDRASLSYGVCAENTKQPDITFEGTIDLANFSTWKQDQPATIDLDFRFEQTSPLNVHFALDQKGKGRDFNVTGELKDYDLVKINPLMVVAANADIESGRVHSLSHNFSNVNNVSSGELTFRYEKLEVKFTGKKAFFGNLLEDIAIRDSNPRNDGDLVIGKVANEHDPTKSFFNHYWQSLVSGMTTSVAGKFFIPDKKEGRRLEKKK